ncbi:MAG: GHKL domain-containing protein [Deltaproteobacteria bacterium]|nr:GHKL domain-containing protein [Deltaproteobacteria bacterium]MBW2016181.1 GHKL domain-containing protein [Deltaproteobacteria bacterium]MBW2130330.1 GHKL domain-containing protein [Deltaproteobacteria bacterium]MBW2302702.1 GHKL domain-containing protein [Deltaproteobacteria bacterium]
MVPASQKAPSEGKQFRLVKFFAWASFIVLVIFSFPFSMVISQQAKEILLRSYENYALLVGQNLNHQVFQNFVIPVYRRYGQIRLREEEQYELMDRVVRNTIHGFNVDLVNIYDIGKGVIAYSTDRGLIGKECNKTAGYLKAVKGESSSRLISSSFELWGLGLEMGGTRKLRTYIPFQDVDPFTGDKGHIGGVFELIQDLTPQYESIVRFQFLVIGLSILIMGLIFVVLLLIVHKAETVIEQRARERRELEAQLHQAERLAALGEMVAGVSHEIKNPLGIIRSTAELLGSMPNTDETQKKLSEVITEESTRLNQIVTEFLDFARPQEPNLHPCNLGEILRKNLSFLEPELEKRGITVSHNIGEQPLELSADHDQLYRAFQNLLINAIQAMDDGGRIDIHVGEGNGNYLVAIRDSGCGISPENLRKIFNPFFTTKERGSGLGLSIVKKIVEGHNGRISIESRVNQGTRILVRLPRNP